VNLSALRPLRFAFCIGVLVTLSCGGADAPTGSEARSFMPTTTLASNSASNALTDPSVELRTVSRVIDGDTIVVDQGERVRFIGVDTPETKDPRKPVQCFGEAASAFTSSLIPPGTQVRLVYDVERTDRYGRTLAYVYRADDDLFVNAALVRDGYAVSVTYPPDVAHADEFAALASDARAAGRGLWGTCDGDDPASEPTTTALAAPQGTSTQPVAGTNGAEKDCDGAYPTVCIPSPPPDLDCDEIQYRRFEVLSADPHGFDRDGDGIGCES
jgi:micrococcal nuclease